jgi:hypothetical protein
MNFHKAMRTPCALSLVLIGGVFAACAGSSTPKTDDDQEAAIAAAFANGTGVAGGAGGAAAGSGGRASGGTGGRASGGSGGRASGGSAGSAQASEAGAAGSGDTGGSSSGGCDAFGILAARCSGAGCHGAGSSNSNFAESEAIAESLAGSDPVTAGCEGESTLINPDNPRDSLLILKVNGTTPCGSPMPLIPPPLTDDEVTCLEDWIGSL